MQKIGLKRDLRCINPCKSGDGSYLKKLTSPPKGGGRSGNFRGSTNQKSGNCHELSRKSVKFVFTHPTPGGSRGGRGWGSTFQKSGKFHEPHPTPPGVGSFMGKNVKCQTFHELSRKSIFLLGPPPHPIRRGGGLGAKMSK